MIAEPVRDALLCQRPFSIKQADKEHTLLMLLRDLTQHHRDHCPAYRQITDLAAPNGVNARILEDLPYLPVSLFKWRTLRSVPESEIRTTITSSGTTGQQLSRIDLDAETAKLSAKALSLIIGSITQNQRLPFLIIDNESALSNHNTVGARAAAILGLMPYGRDPCFVLHEDFSVDHAKLDAFLERHPDELILAFGFTYLIWQYFIPACEQHLYNLSRVIMLHSGGWKKLQDQAVDNAKFKNKLNNAADINRVINFYGMAELPGTIFLENEDGLLYPPSFADVIIRDPITLETLPKGQPGLIQIVSALPRSYPGHSILTEDIGVIEKIDGGVNDVFGNGFSVLGRAPRAEQRGCSDVLAGKEVVA